MREVEALRTALRQNSPDGLLFEKPPLPKPALRSAIWRFLKAWSDCPELGPDHAVLLRQIARWSGGEFHVGSCPNRVAAHFAKSRITISETGTLRAEAFHPDWLDGDGIPESGLDSIPTARRTSDSIPAESYLSQFGFRNWRSAAQKEAVWLALTTHPGQTTLIVLPTGMGKSLCFQLLALFGTGLTVVVVPTVALAIDQWKVAERLFADVPGIGPLYFAAQDPDIDPDHVTHSIRTGKCRLVYTSPEACVSGRLRKVIDESAANGRLENLVLDEAHLIDTWGAFFRVDFQVLAGLRRQWLERSDGGFRTLLLSATITPSCRMTLRDLFPSHKWASNEEFQYQQLRSEMVYYDRRFDSDTVRDSAVLECVWHLPRPAIVYTTEVQEAKDLFRRLYEQQGFRRIGCFHGDTRPSERRRLLTQWRNDELDLMVATSAFGLGVDKPDVRTVVHACYPEDLNRYYQEVGRGGRDGYSSICLLLPTKQDYVTAANLSPTLMKESTVQRRWEGLWQSGVAINEDNYTWKLQITAKPQNLIGARTWSEHVRWNKRLILQLLRAGKIKLLNVHYERQDADSEPTEWVEIQLQSGFSPGSPEVGESIASQREEELANARKGLEQINAYLSSHKCISRTLRDLYGESTQRVCGGCRWCRRQGRPPGLPPQVEFDLPTDPEMSPRVSVVENCPPVSGPRPRALLNVLRRCVEEKGIRRFASDTETQTALLPVFTSLFPYRFNLYRVDDVECTQPFILKSHERIVVFHFGQVNANAAKLDRGNEVIHLLAEGLEFQHIRYALPSRCTQPEFYPNPESWLT